MTREEKLDWLYRLRSEIYVYMPKDWCIPMHKALNMAIDALEQKPCNVYEERGLKADTVIIDEEAKKPCEDAVSRNQSNACSILDDECPYPHKHCWECPLNYQYELAKHELDKNVDLPSVTVRQTGEWILLDECANSGYYCSRCQKKLVKEGWSDTVKKIKFCPNCGAKMESEDKE